MTQCGPGYTRAPYDRGYAQPRRFWLLWARDGHFFKSSKLSNPKYSTPTKETNLHKAKTKTRLPTVVKLDTGNNYHSLEHVDDLKKVDLFDDKKVELDFKIGNNIAAAAFFTR